MEIIRSPATRSSRSSTSRKPYLVPKQREANGLDGGEHRDLRQRRCSAIIRHYTKEAGVRNLEREIATVCRKAPSRWCARSRRPRQGHHQEPAKYLGPPRSATARRRGEPSRRATGLAWTELGGELLTTEVTVMPGKGKLTITGKLGDVMQESAQAAMSYVRSRAEELGLERDFYQKVDIHIHVPEGAIPKDGPSAGITMATASCRR
jgi:ATP-dependent Lon protease